MTNDKTDYGGDMPDVMQHVNSQRKMVSDVATKSAANRGHAWEVPGNVRRWEMSIEGFQEKEPEVVRKEGRALDPNESWSMDVE